MCPAHPRLSRRYTRRIRISTLVYRGGVFPYVFGVFERNFLFTVVFQQQFSRFSPRIFGKRNFYGCSEHGVTDLLCVMYHTPAEIPKRSSHNDGLRPITKPARCPPLSGTLHALAGTTVFQRETLNAQGGTTHAYNETIHQ